MRKLKLDLEALDVESFVVVADPNALTTGTVRGNASDFLNQTCKQFSWQGDNTDIGCMTMPGGMFCDTQGAGCQPPDGHYTDNFTCYNSCNPNACSDVSQALTCFASCVVADCG